MVDKLFISGASDKIDGVLLYRCTAEFDADGYITGIGTDPKGDIVIPAADMAKVVIGASKLVDGKIVTDQAKRAELSNPAPNPTVEQQLIASLSLRLAQLEAKS